MLEVYKVRFKIQEGIQQFAVDEATVECAFNKWLAHVSAEDYNKLK